MNASIDALQILQTHSVSDLVREEILRQIKAGELAGGDKLNEIIFAQRFKVSRGPVREAFRALVEVGLVKLEKNRGVFVREIGEPEARELYELRATLDEMSGRLLAARITDADIAELRIWLVRLAELPEREEGAQSFPMNIAFHDRIVEMAANATLLEFYRRVVDRMHLLRRRNFSSASGREASQAEHEAIVDALATRDPMRAGDVMRAHVMNGYRRFTLHADRK
ncbi:FCD domain-containing protein [Agrobacterium rhizogenes]|uniref:FCD domain-containing protein n=1 Tax=Rhizobium rhizogenes TaxID=359 RepID=UPI001571731A|nr:FCD domain-containing protein [Rhizobium rhizogenes]NTF90885.1 FCD domain-containing protein [Rhizobium rhizogenes]